MNTKIHSFCKRLVCILFFGLATSGLARDFIVEFIEENYKETQAQFSYTPLIYHSIQVNSSAGPKILILTGNDYNYRKWLRHYIAQDKKFITKIPDDRLDEFISSKVYMINVTSLHPFNGEKWKKGNLTTSDQNTIEGDNHIFIVDPNEKKLILYKLLSKKWDVRQQFLKPGNKLWILLNYNLKNSRWLSFITLSQECLPMNLLTRF